MKTKTSYEKLKPDPDIKEAMVERKKKVVYKKGEATIMAENYINTPVPTMQKPKKEDRITALALKELKEKFVDAPVIKPKTMSDLLREMKDDPELKPHLVPVPDWGAVNAIISYRTWKILVAENEKK
jgi:hypothetical protein